MKKIQQKTCQVDGVTISFISHDFGLIYRRMEPVALWVRAFALKADGWMFEYQPRQTLVVKTGSDSSTAEDSITSVTGSRRWPLWTHDPCHSRCGTLKNPQCFLAISAEHSSNFQPFTGYDDVSKWVKNSGVGRKITNKQTHTNIVEWDDLL